MNFKRTQRPIANPIRSSYVYHPNVVLWPTACCHDKQKLKRLKQKLRNARGLVDARSSGNLRVFFYAGGSTMNIEKLLQDRALVFDGATGTNLQTQNLTPDDFGGEHLAGCNEYLVRSKPSAVDYWT